MKNVLITGAGPHSFVGRNLKEALAGQYHVFAPPHAELELLDYDALSAYLAAHKIDVIVHAAVHVPMFNGQEKEFYNDMLMFLNLEKAAAGVEKLIYFGSGAEYDKRYDITMAKEADIGRSIPDSEYGLAKYTMNLMARRSTNIYNLRLFGIFGKYELWHIKFLSNLCCKAIFDLPLTVRRDCAFDFLYIDDLAPVVAWMIEHTPPRHDYNLCHGRPYQLTELARMVKEVSGSRQDINVLNPGRNLDYTGDNSLLRRDCPAFAPKPMVEAVEKLYRYYLDNKNIVDYAELESSQ